MEALLKSLDAGQDYVLQVRAKGSNGQTSSWSTAFKLTTTSDTIAPGPITALSWTAEGTSFVGTWTKPALDSNGKPLKDFRDYKVTLTADSQTAVYFVSQEKFDFSLEANRNSFGSAEPAIQISVQARDTTGNLSTAVVDTATNAVPVALTNFTADPAPEAISLSWDHSTEEDVKFYEVYMSTSGSGFTPGPSNIVYTGFSNKFFFSSNNLVVHYFKACVVDVFGQKSTFVSDSATPSSSAGVDLTPPDDPTDVTVTTDDQTDGYASLHVDWTAVGSSNLSDYLVRYSTDEVAWIYVAVPAGQSEADIYGLLPNTNYYVQVAAMSYANVKSDFVNAATYPILTAADTAAPSKPSDPIVSISTQMAQVSHDMTKDSGGDLESDVVYLEVHADTASGFTPSNSTLRGTIDTAGPGIDVSGAFYVPITDSVATYFWKVIAVDRAKNKSVASDPTAGVPGLIENANILHATITSAKIQSLEANKITAGTGIINALDVKNTLTIGSGGHVRSTNWNGTDTGWSLDETGLVIYGGSIFAAALLLQDSANIIPPPFADFELNDDYYHTAGAVNTVTMSTVGTGVTIGTNTASPKFGSKALRLSNGVITNPTVHDLVFAPSGLSATGVNIDVSPGTYIYSGYFKKNGSVDAEIKFGLYPETGSAIASSAVTVNSTSWTRFEVQLVVPSGVSRVKAYLEFGPAASNTGYDFLVDGLQLERKIAGSTAAGIWRPSSKTTIDGGQIVTGSIRSSAMSSVVPTQPAWSINTAGNMQIGSALVRGSITVGDTAAPTNLMPSQFTSFENASSYYHDGSNNVNTDNISDIGAAKLEIITDPEFDTQALRIFETGSPTSGNSRQIPFTNIGFAPAGNNIGVIAGQDYFISAYFKNKDVTKQVKVGFGIYSGPGTFGSAMGIVGGDVDISSSTSSYTRVYGKWTAPPGFSDCQVVLFITPIGGSTGFNISMDGMMFEIEKAGQVLPGTYTNTTGEISYVRSGNYISGYSGWSIGNDGAAEFNDGFFRGQLDISTFFNNEPYGTNISNVASVWRSRNWVSFDEYIVSGVEPAIKFTGTGFKPTSAGGLTTTRPFQVVFRGSPEGGYQLMADGTDSDRIYNIDANNDLDEDYADIEDVYGYSDLRAGRGYNRDFTAIAANDHLPNDNMYYTQLQTKSQLYRVGVSEPAKSETKTGFWSRTDASPLSYEFVPQSQTEYTAESALLISSINGNLIPDPWDLMDGVIGTYNTNSVRNRVTLDSMGTLFSTFAPLTSSTATSGLINCVNATFLSAGSGDSTVFFSTTDTTYNVTVEPGCEYNMGMQFALPTSLNGKQFQFLMKLSNGTLLTSSLITLSSTYTGLGTVANDKLSMGYANVFTIPAGITSCLVGFRIIGGVASNTTFSFGAGLLYKTRNADGTYTSTYNRHLQVPRSYASNYTSKALIRTGAAALPPDLYNDNDNYANAMAQIRLRTESFNITTSTSKTFDVSLSPNGMRWGENTEYRPQHGVSIRTTTASIAVTAGGGSVDLPTTSGSPAVFNVVTTQGQNQSTDWNTAGSTYSTSAPTGLFARRAGLYIVSIWASTGNGTAGQYLEVANATTGVRYALGGLPPGTAAQDLSVVGLVPCSAGDRIACRYLNFSTDSGTRTITQYRITMAQLI